MQDSVPSLGENSRKRNAGRDVGAMNLEKEGIQEIEQRTKEGGRCQEKVQKGQCLRHEIRTLTTEKRQP